MNKQKIMSIIKNSISLVKNFDSNVPLEKQCEKQHLLESLQITEKQFNLFPVMNKKAIGIRNIFEDPCLRLTIYYLEEGNIMKLHDHNQMHVVSKILSGKIQAKLYRELIGEHKVYEKTVKIFDSGSTFFIDGNKSFNLHQFKALEPTFFLDIIFPDYSMENDCNFYREKQALNQNKVELQKVENQEILFEDI